MDHKLTPSRPKLDRLNAAKNFEYHPSSSSSSFSLGVSPHRARSLPFDSKSSFRINGLDGEFDLLCQTLGFSGPEDFAIPTSVWESEKVRRSSFDTPSHSASSLNFQVRAVANDSDLDKNFDSSRFLGEVRLSEKELDRNSVRFSNLKIASDSIELDSRAGINRNGVSVRTIRDFGGGLKGDRPPVLAPPPGMVQRPVVDQVRSTWDILESSAPKDDEDSDASTPGDRVTEENREGENGDADEEIEQLNRNGVSVRTIRDFGGGLKGDRPSVLAPPPAMLQQPVVDHASDREIEEIREGEDGDADEETEQLNRNGVGENENPSEPCTSNDEYSDGDNDGDDTRIATMLPVHSISPNASFRRNISSWQKGELLGSGSFGSVFEGFTDYGFFFAVKEVSLLDQGNQGKQRILQLEQEISLLREFEHENIVRYLGTDKDESNLYIFLELATKGSLARLYHKYHLRDSQVSAYTRQILNGLRYLHDRGVVHRDIKCANILVDANGSVKLADFGLAKATRTNDIKSCKGTAFWMAPEVVNLRNRTYGRAADIWSLGCTVLEMLTGQPPYSHLEGMQALFKIGRGEPPLVPNTLSEDARDFILKCLKVNPNDRPTAAQLVGHPFVKRPIQPFSIPPSPRFINSPEKF